ncbi:LOW QUALITY PROTEIN: hypothetical protein MAR_005825 [Mya arenaria]|uniref:Uncharacterized protein n=1 Tax=Mya arenaria TaxID=6604 RepID=A0ABY7F0L9_MYAAR|nr:LOW QUALITY PROTEIN: hypothetical protein MAR_005825 [Mya arenaria]
MNCWSLLQTKCSHGMILALCRIQKKSLTVLCCLDDVDSPEMTPESLVRPKMLGVWKLSKVTVIVNRDLFPKTSVPPEMQPDRPTQACAADQFDSLDSGPSSIICRSTVIVFPLTVRLIDDEVMFVTEDNFHKCGPSVSAMRLWLEYKTTTAKRYYAHTKENVNLLNYDKMNCNKTYLKFSLTFIDVFVFAISTSSIGSTSGAHDGRQTHDTSSLGLIGGLCKPAALSIILLSNYPLANNREKPQIHVALTV